MTGLLAALAGVAITAGAVLAVAGMLPAPVSSPQAARSRPRWRWPSRRNRAGWRTLAAAIAGAAVWLATGMPVAAAIVAITVWGLPILLSTSTTAAARIDRLEAVEEWTRRLADVLVVGVGLEQAITATTRTCPQLVSNEVETLSARLQARWTTEAALRAFADDLDDATADLVVATLILAARRRGPGLPRVLAAVADSVADEVAMRRTVEADRAKPRATARAVTFITLGVVAVGSLNTTYLQPYQTLLGQLVLAAITVGFVAALAWMRALTLTTPASRLFQPRTTTAEPQLSWTAGRTS